MKPEGGSQRKLPAVGGTGLPWRWAWGEVWAGLPEVPEVGVRQVGVAGSRRSGVCRCPARLAATSGAPCHTDLLALCNLG